MSRIFASTGLRVYDVEELPTHGGSLRVYGCHADSGINTSPTVARLLENETGRSLCDLATYRDFQHRVDRVKSDLTAFFAVQKRSGKSIAGYGAAAKGNTLLNYAHIKSDLLPYVCDAAPSKQNKFLPGSHIPICPPMVLRERQPDIVLILPWNIADEVMSEHRYIREWGGKFAVAVPTLRLL